MCIYQRDKGSQKVAAAKILGLGFVVFVVIVLVLIRSLNGTFLNLSPKIEGQCCLTRVR